MQITSVEPFHFRMPLERPISDARNTITERSTVLVRVETDEGLLGWGEAASFVRSGELVSQVIRHFADQLRGQDATTPSLHYERLFHGSQHFGRRGLVVSALSGIDVALWDILGKWAGLPVRNLLGGGGDVRAYYNAGYYTDDHREFLEESLRFVCDSGVGAAKIKLGRHGFEDDAWRIRTAREILGPSRDFMVDANASLTAREVVHLDEVMCAARVRWVEEPVRLVGVEALRELRANLRTPVAGYELEMTLDGWAPLISGRAVDIAQPDAIWSGGITECARIAALCTAHAIEFIPHNFASLVGLAANAHLASAAPTGGWLEVDSNTNPFLWELDTQQRWGLAGGLINIPDAPGLGVEPDLARIEKYRVQP